MTHPVKRATEGPSGGARRRRGREAGGPKGGDVAASIPNEKEARPFPARARGMPVFRNQRAIVRSGRQSSRVEKTRRIIRAAHGSPLAVDEGLPGGRQSGAVGDTRGTRRLATPAAQAAVEVLAERGVGRRDGAGGQGAHQDDAPARAVILIAGGQIGRAGRQAESAVHARRERSEDTGGAASRSWLPVRPWPPPVGRPGRRPRATA